MLIVIPARYKSSRFPGKPLADIAGKSLIRRVWERCLQAASAEDVLVATDDDRIREHCDRHGMRVRMTGDCLTGTDRTWKAVEALGIEDVVNVQGDEPLISPDDIRAVVRAYESDPCAVYCGMCEIVDEADFRSPTVVKIMTAPDGRLLYASRAPIPTDKRHGYAGAMKQVSIYAFSRKHLAAFANHGKKTPLEAIEDIEILRFLELGFPVRMVRVTQSSIAVDHPEDVARVVEHLRLSCPDS